MVRTITCHAEAFLEGDASAASGSNSNGVSRTLLTFLPRASLSNHVQSWQLLGAPIKMQPAAAVVV